MKKRMSAVLIAVLLAAAVLGALLIVQRRTPTTTTISDVSVSYNTTTTQTTSEAPSTAPPTSETETEPPPVTEETVIDLDNLTLIDLLPLSLMGGDWDVKHCQGIAVDSERSLIYYSYTSVLVKCDLDGNILGTVSGFKGHLGDLALGDDGYLYCSYYPTGRAGFYIVMFDPGKITKENISWKNTNVARSVFLKAVWDDYRFDVNGNGRFDGGNDGADHRFGCTGIDGLTFGPSFKTGGRGKKLLTAAYIISANEKRRDNDYQVLVQYDTDGWWDTFGKATPGEGEKAHLSGPEKGSGKFFLYTGNTYYGVQTMTYFDELNVWLLSTYQMVKSSFQPFCVFAVDGEEKPTREQLKGQPKGTEGNVLSFYPAGELDKTRGIRGWRRSFGTKGFDYAGSGLFYIVYPYKTWYGTQTAVAYLHIWDAGKDGPFRLAADVGTDYIVGRIKRQ
ncbi:MAG: hypothetical protein II804_04605 [Clostridia bacterium]|nr:hypothetical protein [Clostridia bacterium]